MKSGTQAALAISAGYLLGRRRKTRVAAMLAAAAMTGRVGGLSAVALRRGMKMLGSTEALQKVAPQLGDIADTVRGDLLTAGKAAASAAVSSRVESFSDSLHQRAELARNPGAAAAGAGTAARDGAASTVRGVRRAGRAAAGGEDAGQPQDENAGSAEPDDADFDDADFDEAEGAQREAAEETRPPRRARRTTTSQRRTPVTRARR